MNKNVVYLHGQPKPVGHFLRVGTSGHRQLETLLGSGKMMVDRVVVEASAALRQHDLLTALTEVGGELILDSNVAELTIAGQPRAPVPPRRQGRGASVASHRR